jgi:hypothetical protein
MQQRSSETALALSLFSNIFPPPGEEATEFLCESGVVARAIRIKLGSTTAAAGLEMRHGSSLGLMLAAGQFLTDSEEFSRFVSLSIPRGVSACFSCPSARVDPQKDWEKWRARRPDFSLSDSPSFV